MNESVFRYVLSRLSILTDEELEEIDFNAGLSVIEKNDLSPDDYNKLKTLFLNIQKQLPISHHGVLGMKWGVRRYQNKDGSLTSAGRQRLADDTAKQSIFGTASRFTVKTRDGELITAEPVKPLSLGTKIVNALLGISEKDELGRRGDANYTLNNSKGEKIGELSLFSKNAKTTYWDWLTIDKSQRGKGYATDIINDLFTKAKDAGYSKVEINALKKPRPLYERLGFAYTDTSKMSIMDRINGYELGAKHMEYDLTKLKHSSDGSLSHYGVLGMKWGIRKDRLSLKTKSGDTITLSEQPSSKLASFLAKYSKRAAAEQEKTAIFNIKDPDGNTVGDITLYKEAPDSINVVWVSTNKSVRGRGYGTAVMKSAIQVAKDTGAKQVTLEVPGSSPDAKHIYEKLGFKEVASPDKDVNDAWGGLTNMRLDLNEIKHSLSSGALVDVSMDISKKYMSYLVTEIDKLDAGNHLTHYGVLGMKWGVRRYQNKDGTLTSAGKKRYDRDIQTNLSKKKDSRIDTSNPDPKRWVKEDTERKKRIVNTSSDLVKQMQNIEKETRPTSTKQKMDLSKMTDKEMRDRINRELLENQYNNLFAPEIAPSISKGRDFSKKTLDVAGNVLALTGSALSIALAIKELKG